MIRHVVMFNLIPAASPKQAATLFKAAKYSLSQIPGVRNLAVSTSFEAVQPPCYRYGLTMEFADEKTLRSYLDHPIHQEFRKLFFPLRDDYLVMTSEEMEVPE